MLQEGNHSSVIMLVSAFNRGLYILALGHDGNTGSNRLPLRSYSMCTLMSSVLYYYNIPRVTFRVLALPGAIPAELGRLKALKTLRLWSNHLNGDQQRMKKNMLKTVFITVLQHCKFSY